MKTCLNFTPKKLIFSDCVCSETELTPNVPALGEVANFGTDYFLANIIFLAKSKREFTTKFAILPNACCMPFFISLLMFSTN